MSIARLPPVLAMHVKRFEAGGTHSQVTYRSHGKVQAIKWLVAADVCMQRLLPQPMLYTHPLLIYPKQPFQYRIIISKSVLAGLQAPRKLATPVSFPLDVPLDMRPFLSSSVLAQRCGLRLQEAEQDAADGVVDEEDAPAAAQYRAYAVVCHHGNMQGGHYTAYIR